jgi:hypothetical protein
MPQSDTQEQTGQVLAASTAAGVALRFFLGKKVVKNS